LRVEVEAMGALCRNLEGVRNSCEILRVESHDEWRICDVHVESSAYFVVHGPSRTSRENHGPDHGLQAHIDEGNGRGVWYLGFADVGHEQEAPRGVESESVGTDTDRDPDQFFLPASGEDANRVLSAIRGK